MFGLVNPDSKIIFYNNQINSIKMFKKDLHINYSTVKKNEKLKKILEKTLSLPVGKKETVKVSFDKKPQKQLQNFNQSLGIVSGTHLGTGIIISKRMILTCAHCVLQTKDILNWKKKSFRRDIINKTFFYRHQDRQIKKVTKFSDFQKKASNQSKYGLQEIILSENLRSADGINMENDWAILIIKNDKEPFPEELSKNLKIVINQSDEFTNNAYAKGYYIGYYLEKDQNDEIKPEMFNPFYVSARIDLKSNKNTKKWWLQHEAETQGGSSGGALIYSQLINHDQYQFILLGMHKSKLEHNPTKKGVLLDLQFKRKYQNYLLRYEQLDMDGYEGERSEQSLKKFINYSDFKKCIHLYQKQSENIKQTLISAQNNYSYLRLFILELIKLKNRYLYLAFKKQSLEGKKINNYFKLIYNFENPQNSTFELELRNLPLDNLADYSNLDQIKDKFKLHNENMLLSFITFQKAIFGQENNVNYKFPNRIKQFFSDNMKNELFQTCNFTNIFSILVKLLNEFTIESVEQILSDSNKGILLQFLKDYENQNVESYIYKFSSRNLIKQFSLLLKHSNIHPSEYIALSNFTRLRNNHQYLLKQLIKSESDPIHNLLKALKNKKDSQLQQQVGQLHFQQTFKFLYLITFQQVFNLQNKKPISQEKLSIITLKQLRANIQENIKTIFKEQFQNQIVNKALLNKTQAADYRSILEGNLDMDFKNFCLLINIKYCEKIPYQTQNLSIVFQESKENIQKVIKDLRSSVKQPEQIKEKTLPRCEQLQLKLKYLNKLKESFSANKRKKQKTFDQKLQKEEVKKSKVSTLRKIKQFNQPIVVNSKEQARQTKQNVLKDNYIQVISGDHLYRNYVGLIKIKKVYSEQFDSKGTGALVGKGVVLTAYHNIELFIKNKKEFSCKNITFELQNDDKTPYNIVKIRYSKFYDWAFLYLEKKTPLQPIFTLITHNNHIEKSNLVGKNYYCQIFGFRQKQPQLKKSCGNLFIEQSYSSGFQYQLSTDHHMSGSPLIIYPSGEIIGPQHIKPFIIGVHTEGHNNCEEDLKRKNPCHEEKYNYGKKIMKDFLSSEQNDYKEITCTQNKVPVDPHFQTIHQNDLMFSDYRYLRNKIQFTSNYLKIQDKSNKDLKDSIISQFEQYFNSDIYFQEIGSENMFFYKQKEKQFHRLFNVKIKVIPSQYRPFAEVKEQKQLKLEKSINQINNLLNDYQTIQELHKKFQRQLDYRVEDFIFYLTKYELQREINSIIKEQISYFEDPYFVANNISKLKYQYYEAKNYKYQQKRFNQYRYNIYFNVRQIIELETAKEQQLCVCLVRFIMLKKIYQIENYSNNLSLDFKFQQLSIQKYEDYKFKNHFQKIEQQINKFIQCNNLDVEKLDVLSQWNSQFSGNQNKNKDESLYTLTFQEFYNMFNNNELKLLSTIRKYHIDSTQFLINTKKLICFMQIEELWSYFFNFLQLSTGTKRGQLEVNSGNIQSMKNKIIPKQQQKINGSFKKYQQDLEKRQKRLDLIDRIIMNFQEKEEHFKPLFQLSKVFDFYYKTFKKDNQEFQKKWKFINNNIQDEYVCYSQFQLVQKKKINAEYNLNNKQEKSTILDELMKKYSYFAENENYLNLNKIIYLELRLFDQLNLHINFQLWDFITQTQIIINGFQRDTIKQRQMSDDVKKNYSQIEITQISNQQDKQQQLQQTRNQFMQQ